MPLFSDAVREIARDVVIEHLRGQKFTATSPSMVQNILGFIGCLNVTSG